MSIGKLNNEKIMVRSEKSSLENIVKYLIKDFCILDVGPSSDIIIRIESYKP